MMQCTKICGAAKKNACRRFWESIVNEGSNAKFTGPRENVAILI